jgi:hypothetical protein
MMLVFMICAKGLSPAGATTTATSPSGKYPSKGLEGEERPRRPSPSDNTEKYFFRESIEDK